jgi:large subunit ribosomal protein L27e
VVQAFEANQKRPYPHVLIAGIAKGPKKVSAEMSKEKILKRSSVKSFVKFVNVSHIMPTRYNASDIDVKSIVVPEKVDKLSTRSNVRFATKKAFKAAYINRKADSKNAAGVAYFFQKLRF